MKTKQMKQIVILFSWVVTASASSAFTFDFNSRVASLGSGATSGDSLIINVPGYGDVRFDVAPGAIVDVGDSHENDSGELLNSLQLDAGETVVVTFLGPQAMDVNFDFAGVNPGTEVTQTKSSIIGPSEHQVNSIGSEGSGGLGE